MKKVWIMLLALVSFTRANSQNKEADNVLQQIKTYYNDTNYAALYNLLSEDAKKQMSKEETIDFFKNNLYKNFGRIKSYEFESNENRLAQYTVQFDEMLIELKIAINKEGSVDGWMWTPSLKTRKKVDPKTNENIRSNNALSSEQERFIDSVTREYVQANPKAKVCIGIIHDDTVKNYFYGVETMPDENTAYQIGSITKTFTGILLAHAVNENKINLHDDIRKYLPAGYDNLAYNDKPITVVMLSNHTSGLPRLPDNLDKQKNFENANPYKNYSRQMMLEYLKQVRLGREPGIKAEYSNFGTALLGVILESATGQKLDQQLKEVITMPLGMSHTKYLITKHDAQDVIPCFDEKGKRASAWTFNGMEAAGGIASTLSDMLRYLSANMEDKNADMKLSHQPTTDINIQDKAGLNWMLQQSNGKDMMIWHNGGTSGFMSFCGFYPDKKSGIIVLSNCGASVDLLAVSMLENVAND